MDSSVYTEIRDRCQRTDQRRSSGSRRKQKKKMRIIQSTTGSDYPYDLKVHRGSRPPTGVGRLQGHWTGGKLTFPTKAQPEEAVRAKLLAAWEVVRRVPSNGIVIADGRYENGRVTALLDPRGRQLPEEERRGQDRAGERGREGQGGGVRVGRLLPLQGQHRPARKGGRQGRGPAGRFGERPWTSSRQPTSTGWPWGSPT